MSVAGTVAPYPIPRFSGPAVAAVLGAHLAIIAMLAYFAPAVLPAPLQVLSVSLLPATPQVKPEPQVTPPKPKPVESRPRPVQPPQQIAAPQESPALTPVAVPPAPTLPAPAAPASNPAPVQTVQPRFDADYLDNPKPPYPALSRRLGEQGRVVLRVHVNAGGGADDVQLQASSGSPRLDQSALDTVRRWKFVPARRGAEAVAAWVLVPIAFTLKE